jgi:putative oxidoreductase
MKTSAPLDPLSPYLLSVLRIMSALLFLEHGTSKLLGVPPAAMHAAPAIPPPPFLMFLMQASGPIELVGGILLALGLFSRFTAFILSGEMAVAYFTAHAPHDFFPMVNKGEIAVLYCFVFLYLAAAGGGPWSLDRLRHRG